MITFVDAPVQTAPPESLTDSIYTCELTPFPQAERLGFGIFVTSASDALALKRVPDVTEHQTEPPTTCYDIEKWCRMLLHQSRLAFELAVAPHRSSTTTFEPREWVPLAMTRSLLVDYQEIARHTLRDVSEATPTHARIVLTGLLLAEENAVSLDTGYLTDHFQYDGPSALL